MTLITVTISNVYSEPTKQYWWHWRLVRRDSLRCLELGTAASYESAAREAAVHMKIHGDAD